MTIHAMNKFSIGGVIMSKGFLIFAQNNEKDDYVKQAYLCALSGTYSGNKNFTLVTDNLKPQEYYPCLIG